MKKKGNRPNRNNPSMQNISRRDALKLGALGSAGLFLPSSMGPTAARAGDPPSLQKWKDPLPLPGTFQANPNGVYDVRMEQFKQELHSDIGKITDMWGYGGKTTDVKNLTTVPGGSFDIHTNQGLTRVNWMNQLANNPSEPHYLEIDPSILDPRPGHGIHGATDDRKTVVHVHGGHTAGTSTATPKTPSCRAITGYTITSSTRKPRRSGITTTPWATLG